MIRLARIEDVTAIVQLLADDPLGGGRETVGDLSPYRHAFGEIEADGATLFAVYEDAQRQVIGCLQVSFLPGLSHRGARRCLIEDVRVSQTHRGKGLGRALIDWAITEARRRDRRIVELFMHRDRAPARRLYQALGFLQEHDGFRLLLT